MSYSRVTRIAEAKLPTRSGEFRILGFEGELAPDEAPGPQGKRVDEAVALVYEEQEGRGIGLMAKLRAYELQDQGLDTVEANVRLGYRSDHRDFSLPAEILRQMGIQSVRLITNNPEKVAALETHGVHVVERLSAEVEPTTSSEAYLQVKREKMGHLIGSV